MGLDHAEHTGRGREGPLPGEHAGAARQLAVHVRHTGCRLLVARHDRPDLRLAPMQSLIDFHHGTTWHPEEMINPGLNEAVHDPFGRVPVFAHVLFPPPQSPMRWDASG